MMRHQTRQPLIPECLNKSCSIKLMQPGLSQAWRVPDIVNITGGNQHIAIKVFQ
jgi:hypothetical protein